MFRELFRFELFYQRKQRALYLLSLVFLGYGLLIGSQGHSPANVNFDSVYQFSYYTGIMTLGATFIVMFFAISGVIRDKKNNFEHIIYSTSLSKPQYFLSRFLGVFLFSLLTFMPYFIGFYLGTQSPTLDANRLSGFNLLLYFQTWLFFVVPNVFICASMIYSVALLSKNTVVTYISGVFIYFLYIMSSVVLNSPIMAQSIPSTPEGLMIASLLDPFGLTAFFEQTQFWTAFQKNNQQLELGGYLLWNRILWMCFAVGVLLSSYHLFSFRKTSNQPFNRKKKEMEAVPSITYSPVNISLNLKQKWLSFITLLQTDVKAVFRSLPFIGVIGMWIAIVVGEFYARIIEGGSYNDSWYASTNLMIELFTSSLQLLSIVLIVFYSGELVWRSRDHRFNSIIDSTPVSNVLLYISKLVAIIALPLMLISTGVLLAIGFQVYTGYFNFELDLYLSLFYYEGVSLVFFSIIVLFIQYLIPNKYLAMGVSGILILMLRVFPHYIGIEHPMLRLGAMPIPSYTNMNGYSIVTVAFNHYTLYWLSIGLVLSCIGFRLYQRGAVTTKRITKLLKGWENGQRIALGIGIVVLLSSGSTIYYHTNVKGEYHSSTKELDQREQYERKYKQYDSLDRLSHVSFKTEVDLYPSQQRYTVKANHILRNKNNVPVYQVFINERSKVGSLELEKGKLKAHDSVYGTYLFEFLDGIQPGEEVNMRYYLEKKSSAYEIDKSIVENGSYITFQQFEPKLGYSKSMEITDVYEREKRGLPIYEEEDALAHMLTFSNSVGKTSYETIISTEGGQIALGTGNLVKKWNSEERDYYHYVSPVKVVPSVGYFSAKYATQTSSHRGISIEQYYHPEHNYNVDLIEESTKRTLDYCLEHFGDYPFDHLRIAEIPGHWPFGGFCHPGTISMVEDRLYLVDVRSTETFNLVAKRTIHEVAHQWWGAILTPKIIEGGSIFVEGFAKYTEAVVMEKMYGKGALWQIAQTANNTYFQGRTFATKMEPPVYLEDGENYLAYGKHYTVLMALKDLIGEDKVNQVMRTLVDRYRDSKELEVTSLHLLEEIFKVTPQEYHELINDWFKRVIRYDLSAKEASYKKLANGKYEVSMVVNAKRFETMKNGEEVQIELNEPINIGVFTTHPKNVKADNIILYLQPHVLNKDEVRLSVIVDQEPVYVAIDPYGTRSDENLYDNIVELN